MGVIKGQNFRLLIGGKVVALSKSCTLHRSADLSDTTTKDSTGLDKEQQTTGRGWDGSVNGLVAEPDELETAHQGLDLLDLIGETVQVEFDQVGGDKNRTPKAGTVKRYGDAIVNDVSLEFPDRADSTYTMQFQGTGPLNKGTVPTPPGGGGGGGSDPE